MLPTLFEFGWLKIPSFGLMVMLGFLAGLLLARRRAERFGLTKDQVTDIAFWVLISGILGARIAYILQEIPHYRAHPEELLTWQLLGMTSFGGLIGGAIALWIAARRHGVPPIAVLDTIAPGLLLGHAFGRVGCFLNGCCYGHACPPPLGMAFAGAEGTYQPAQLYDAAMNLIGLLLFALTVDRATLRPGQPFGFVLIVHGLARFIYEFWRAGTTSTTMGNLPFTEAHVAALVTAGIGVWLMLRRARQPVIAEVPS